MQVLRRIVFASVCAALALSVGDAGAAEGELVFTEALRSRQTARSPVGGAVRLYGPLRVSAAIRSAKELVHLYLDRVDFAGEAADVSIFLVDASRRGRRRIRLQDYVTGVGNVKGMIEEVVDIPQTIHDAAGAQRPLTHLKKMRRVMLAVVVRSGTFEFERIVIAAKARPAEGEDPASAAPTPASDPASTEATSRRELPGELALTVRTQRDQGDGTTALFSPQVYLAARFAQATQPIYVYLDGLRMGPGAQAEVYLVDRDFQRVDPRLLIGAIEPPASGGGPTAPVGLEIKDFDHAGVRRVPRSTMRGFAHFALALRIRRGPVSVDRLVLSGSPPATRAEGLRRGEGR